MKATLFVALTFFSISSASAFTSWLATSKQKFDNIMSNRVATATTNAIETSEGSGILSKEQIQIFERDGVLLVRGLVSGEELKAAVEEVSLIGKKTSPFFKSYKNIEFQAWRSSKALKDVAIFSNVPKAAAQLINLKSSNKNSKGPIRLLKDAVLCFSPGGAGCGWHVDDKFFWPCHDDFTGVNVWIALSPMSAERGGGLAVSPGSHKEKFAQNAIPIIVAGGTCAMETLAPDVHSRLEKMKVVYNMEPGDAIIHDRWLFHRSDSFKNTEAEDVVLNRYSIRYMSEDARAFDNGFDPVFKDEKHKGKNGQPLKSFEGFFPQVFPSVVSSEIA
jgi:Phytanoyl-CoA dioxygenase (PhyH)